MNYNEIRNSIHLVILALDEVDKKVIQLEQPKTLQNIVIEYQIRGEDGTKYNSVGFTGDYYYGEDDWNNIHENTPDEIPNTLFYDQGIHFIKETGIEVPVTYRNALIRTEKSIDYWIKLLDAVTYDQ
jgi:hypothetical protein